MIQERYGSSAWCLGDQIGQVKFVSRVLPNKVGVKVTNLDLLGVIEDEQLFNELSDEDVVRVCLLISLEEFKVNVDLATTISELKSDWYIGFQDFFMGYIPRNSPVNRNDLYEDYFKKLSAARKRAKIATTDLPMVPRCDSSCLLKEIKLKDNVITQLNTHVSKLEAIIQIIGRHLPLGSATVKGFNVLVVFHLITGMLNLGPRIVGKLHVACKTAEARWAMVGAYFVQILLQDSIPVWYADGSRYKVAWRDLDQVFMPINETDTHWCLAHLDLPSRVVTFYDSGLTYDIEWRDWYILLRECLQSFMRMVNDDLQSTPITSNLQLSCLSPIGTSEGTFSVGDIVLLCGWVLTVDGASVTSFNMLFSLPTNHSVKLIGFTNTDAPIVEVDELGYQLAHTLQVYDPVAEEFRGVGMEADGGSFYIGPYKESLILLNRPDRSLYSLNL
ncbi:phospholipase-like protein [Tanacetum coccineum]